MTDEDIAEVQNRLREDTNDDDEDYLDDDYEDDE